MLKSHAKIMFWCVLMIAIQLLVACSPAAHYTPSPTAHTAYPAADAYEYEEVAGDSAAFSTGGTAPVNDAAYDAVFFEHYGVNPFVDTEDDALSTFATDVDTASYAVARRYLYDGYLPEPDSVRVEEYVNYFRHSYAPPTEGAFAIHMEAAPSPFGNARHTLLRIGLQGQEIDAAERQDASLVFVIDVSGSMEMENRLELVKRSLRLLVEELRAGDEVGLVVYGDVARVVLPPTAVAEKERIVAAIDSLSPGGSTYAEEGLRAGYAMAEEMMERAGGERNVRLILCSDGVANVGNTGPDSILRTVQKYVDEGILLTTVGFGMGNYNDVLLEQLANDGNGQYAYVDTLEEARRIFIDNLTGTLQVIAKDAKVQVAFNPETVRSYRLLGYENRDVADDDFRNDEVDAGEVGAGHSVTALYELKLAGDSAPSGELATVSVRYADPRGDTVHELSQSMTLEAVHPTLDAAAPDFLLDAAVAEFAEILRESYWARDGSMGDVLALVQQVAPQLGSNELLADDVAELMSLVERSMELSE